MRRFKSAVLTAAATAAIITLGGSVHAQPPLPEPDTTAATDRLHDGITIDHLTAIFSAMEVNGESLSVERRETAEGRPYLLVPLPGLEKSLSVLMVDRSYGPPGTYRGYAMIVMMPRRLSSSKARLNEGNLNVMFAKMVNTRDDTLLISQHVTAGGVTARNVGHSFRALMKAHDKLLAGSDQASLVDTDDFVSLTVALQQEEAAFIGVDAQAVIEDYIDSIGDD